MKHIWTVAAGFTLTLGTPAIVNAQTDDPGASEGEDNPATTIICRRAPAPTGSRISTRRICRTEAEWVRLDAEQRGVIENIGNRNRLGSDTSAGTFACSTFKRC